MDVEIPALEDGRLPGRYGADGQAFSPPVAWSGVPHGAASLALVMESVRHDGTREHVHWLAWGIDPGWRRLDEGLMSKPEPDAPEGLRQGVSDSGTTGYSAPVGDIARPQRLCLRLIALDRWPELEPGADARAFDRAVEGRVVAEAALRFEYVRSG